MRKISEKQKQLVAEYFSNIAVAWFAAGVIGPFIGSFKILSEVISSIIFGLALSVISLYVGFYLIKEVK